MNNGDQRTPDQYAQYLYSDMADGDIRRHDRTVCPFCGTRTRGFIVKRHWYGWFLYCHWCNTGRTITQNGLSFSTIHNMIKQRLKPAPLEESHTLNSVSLPHDFTTDIPEAGLMWLRSYRVTDEEISKFRFGYSPGYDRLILPVYGDEGVKYWQGRRLSDDKSQPKYLNFTQSRTEVFFVVDNKHDTTVIVEDILSALAVSRAGYNSIALLGSHANDSVCSSFPGTTHRIKVWLDPDMKTKSVKLAKRIRALGYTASAVLIGTKDPKEYLPEEVQQFIQGEKK